MRKPPGPALDAVSRTPPPGSRHGVPSACDTSRRSRSPSCPNRPASATSPAGSAVPAGAAGRSARARATHASSSRTNAVTWSPVRVSASRSALAAARPWRRLVRRSTSAPRCRSSDTTPSRHTASAPPPSHRSPTAESPPSTAAYGAGGSAVPGCTIATRRNDPASVNRGSEGPVTDQVSR